MQPITAKLKELRRNQNLKQVQLAQKLNCSIASYCKMEKGSTDISYSKLQRLAVIYDLQLYELFLENDEKRNHSEDFILKQQSIIKTLQTEIMVLQSKIINLHEELRL